jgi:hypothetical protein
MEKYIFNSWMRDSDNNFMKQTILNRYMNRATSYYKNSQRGFYLSAISFMRSARWPGSGWLDSMAASPPCLPPSDASFRKADWEVTICLTLKSSHTARAS